jgi:hypothetical protein
MTRDVRGGSATLIVWAEPFVRLAVELRAEVSTFRGIADGAAEAIERTATRLENTLKAASTDQWVLVEDAAPLLRVSPHGLRARCRRSLASRGLAEKRGGLWFVHVSALRST